MGVVHEIWREATRIYSQELRPVVESAMTIPQASHLWLKLTWYPNQ
jgi:hypothetical protein